MTMTMRAHAAIWITMVGTLACARPGDAPKAEPATLNVTDWTANTELYMEYPPLVAAQSARFAVHLTKLDDFKALNAGTPSIEFTPERGGAPAVLRGSPPSRPGAFRVDGAPPAAGRYRWALTIDAPGLTDRHELGTVTVFPDEASAKAEVEKRPADDPAAIAYLKEQQWTNEFATAPVHEGELRTSIRVPASIEPLSGGEAVVAAPASGRFTADALVAIGTTVRSGQPLGRLEPRLSGTDDRATLAADAAQAQVTFDGASAEETRAERLLAERAVPARRAEDARRAVATAEARLRAAEARLAQRDETLRSGGGAASGNAFTVRAPIAGRVADVFATLGASYDEGAPLFKIVRTDRVELRAQIPAPDATVTRDLMDVAFELPGRADVLPLRAEHRHDAGVIDSKTGALPVQFEVQNPRGQLLVGQSGTAVLYKRDRLRVPTVPKAAVLLEAGRPYVFVQIGGERFARRYVEIATRDGNQIGLKSGVGLGDRVVIRGAYEVQLASAAKGLPAEGHVH
ncbi:MAG: efflux RND transporter periplasmic adaptor subunit [Acidobacteria bacterium]|nr:efflux RND transporter periplasmic adaptor subunit [Acidobacteriota bacterium]